MAMKKINYSNKTSIIEDPAIENVNKIRASDMNEIKKVVNDNADIYDNLMMDNDFVKSLDKSVKEIYYKNLEQFNEAIKNNDLVPGAEYYIADGGGIAATSSTPVGAVLEWPGTVESIPANFLRTDGSNYNIVTYKTLFDKLGTNKLPISIANYNQDITTGREAFMGYKVDGKWLYCRKIDMGANPSAAGIFTANIGIDSSTIKIIEVRGMSDASGYSLQLPYVANPTNAPADSISLYLQKSNNTIGINQGLGRNGYTSVVYIYYTKNNDTFEPQYNIIKAREEAYTEDLYALDKNIMNLKDNIADINSALNVDKNFTSNGYSFIPGGLMIQWGSITITPVTGEKSFTSNFGKAFPNNCLMVAPVLTDPGWGANFLQYGIGISSFNATQFTVNTKSIPTYTGTGSIVVRYIAVGF